MYSVMLYLTEPNRTPPRNISAVYRGELVYSGHERENQKIRASFRRQKYEMKVPDSKRLK